MMVVLMVLEMVGLEVALWGCDGCDVMVCFLVECLNMRLT